MVAQQQIHPGRREKDGADKSIALEESAIDCRKVQTRSGAVFIPECARDEGHRGEIHELQPGYPTKAQQGRKHREVQPLRDAQTPRDSPPHDQRTEALAAIKFVILRCVNQVKSRDPENDPEPEHKRREFQTSGRRDPCACGRNRQGKTEEEMLASVNRFVSE